MGQLTGLVDGGSSSREWAVWLLGNLPRETVEPHIASWQTRHPEMHFALAALWSFVSNWVARHWEPYGSEEA